MQDGYSFKSENNGCSIFMNNIFYGRAPQKNGLFLLDLDSSDTHIHNIDAKRIKLNDNSTYMWHCRLGHIGVKPLQEMGDLLTKTLVTKMHTVMDVSL
jgi:hypothetical protein